MFEKKRNCLFFIAVLFIIYIAILSSKFQVPSCKIFVQAKDYIRVDIADLRNLEKDTGVITRGVVAVEPRILAKTYFYIVDEKARTGIQIYMYKQDFPELVVGDLIELKGVLSEAYGETRIKIGEKQDFKILAHGEPPEAWQVSVKEIDESLEGALVQLKGDLLEKKGDYFYLDDGTGEIRVHIKSATGIDKTKFIERDRLSVCGLVSQTKRGYRILARSMDDIEKLYSGLAKNSTAEQEIKIPARHSRTTLKYLVVIIIVLIIILIKLINKKGEEGIRKPKKAKEG